MFSVWQRPQIVWGGGDEAGGGGEGSKGRSKNEMKTQTKINAQLAEREKQGFKGSAAFTPEINDLVAQRERDRAATARNTAGTKYTGLKDMFDGGGPGASGPQFRGGPLSGVTNPFGGGGGGSSPSRAAPAPRQRIGTKGMTSAQRTALTDAGYEVTKAGSVKKNGGTVAGLNFSGSQRVNDIMNSGPLSGERGSFGDAFAAARKKAGGDGGTFTFGGKQFTTNIDTAPKTSLRPQLRPTTTAPAAAPIVDYDNLYEAEAYGSGGIGAAPFGSYAPTPTPTPRAPSSFNLDRALSTPFNIDDNIYMTEDENQLLRNRARREPFEVDDVSAEERKTLAAQPISDLGLDGSVSVLGPDYPPSTDAALFGNTAGFAGQGNFPAYTTSFDDQSAAFSLGDRQRQRDLAGGPTVFDGADARSYDSAGIGDTGFGKYINDALGTSLFQDQVFEDAPLVPANTVAGGGVDPLADTYVAPPLPPSGLFEALQQEYDNEALLSPFGGSGRYIPPASSVVPFTEQFPSVETGVPLDTRTDIERYDDSGQLKPGFSTALQARIEDPTQDLIEAGRERSRDDALRSLRTVNPQAPEDQGFGGAGLASLTDQATAASPVRDPKTQAILDKNEARFLEQFDRDNGYDTVALAGVMRGLGLVGKGLADQTELLFPRETTMDPIAERLYGGSARGDLPSVVGDQNVVAGALDRFGDTTDRLYERMMGRLPQDTRDALEAEIFKDQSLKGVNTEALKAQAVLQLGTMVPVLGSMINPVAAVTTGAGMATGDVNAQTREYVRKRYEESKKAGGELGQITPGQLEYLVTSAQRKATPFASAVGGVTGGLARAGLPLPTILGEVLSEVGLEPSIAEVATATTVGDGIQPQNLYAPRFMDAGLLAAASGALVSGPAALATNRANIPTKAADINAATIEDVGTPSVAESLGLAFGRKVGRSGLLGSTAPDTRAYPGEPVSVVETAPVAAAPVVETAPVKVDTTDPDAVTKAAGAAAGPAAAVTVVNPNQNALFNSQGQLVSGNPGGDNAQAIAAGLEQRATEQNLIDTVGGDNAQAGRELDAALGVGTAPVADAASLQAEYDALVAKMRDEVKTGVQTVSFADLDAAGKRLDVAKSRVIGKPKSAGALFNERTLADQYLEQQNAAIDADTRTGIPGALSQFLAEQGQRRAVQARIDAATTREATPYDVFIQESGGPFQVLAQRKDLQNQLVEKSNVLRALNKDGGNIDSNMTNEAVLADIASIKSDLTGLESAISTPEFKQAVTTAGQSTTDTLLSAEDINEGAATSNLDPNARLADVGPVGGQQNAVFELGDIDPSQSKQGLAYDALNTANMNVINDFALSERFGAGLDDGAPLTAAEKARLVDQYGEFSGPLLSDRVTTLTPDQEVIQIKRPGVQYGSNIEQKQTDTAEKLLKRRAIIKQNELLEQDRTANDRAAQLAADRTPYRLPLSVDAQIPLTPEQIANAEGLTTLTPEEMAEVQLPERMRALAATASGGRPETSPVVPVSSVQLPSDSSGIAGATPAAVQAASPESIAEENPEMAAQIAAMTDEKVVADNLLPPSETPPAFVDDVAALQNTPAGILAAQKLKRPDLQDATDNPLRTVLSNLPLKRKTTAERAAEKSLTPSEIAANRARFAAQENERTEFFTGIGDADMPTATVEHQR